MLILDTNVVAEMMSPLPAPQVLAWVNEQRSPSLFLSSITVGEIAFGLQILPAGKRRRGLEAGFRHLVSEIFAGRILPYDEGAARHFGELMALRRKLGRPLTALDGQIASIARARHFAVATRNVRDFTDCGVEIINPFDPP